MRVCLPARPPACCCCCCRCCPQHSFTFVLSAIRWGCVCVCVRVLRCVINKIIKEMPPASPVPPSHREREREWEPARSVRAQQRESKWVLIWVQLRERERVVRAWELFVPFMRRILKTFAVAAACAADVAACGLFLFLLSAFAFCWFFFTRFLCKRILKAKRNEISLHNFNLSLRQLRSFLRGFSLPLSLSLSSNKHVVLPPSPLSFLACWPQKTCQLVVKLTALPLIVPHVQCVCVCGK